MSELLIKNFKCFYDIKIPLNRLTVLAGANGNGKSTTIQALLFLRRTIEHCAKWEDDRYKLDVPNNLNVELNGAYCLALGNSNFVLPRDASKDEIVLGIGTNNNQYGVAYDTNDGELWLKPVVVFGKSDASSLFKQEFYYLNAERIGPRITQSIKFYDFPNTGYQGEFVGQLLGDTNNNYKIKIEDERKHHSSKSPYLEQQVNAWLDELMPGVSVFSSYNPDTHSAQVRVNNYFTKGEPTLSTNIGFGISYVLPILVSGLIAVKDSYLVIENPEAHLHPSAQSKIGRFLAMVASAGVNVIVETHSDHVLNGIQISVVKGEISYENVVVNFFSQKDDENQPHIDSISINKMGELSMWPKGFFDQTQRDFAELFKLRK
jgi:predicted ATPase